MALRCITLDRRHEELKAVIYDFCESWAGKHAGEFLQGCWGTLLVDDFAGYKQLMREEIRGLRDFLCQP